MLIPRNLHHSVNFRSIRRCVGAPSQSAHPAEVTVLILPYPNGRAYSAGDRMFSSYPDSVKIYARSLQIFPRLVSQ